MNILYISNHLNVGGITSYLLTLAAGIKSKGHKVFIASSGGELLSEFRERGIVYFHIPILTKQEASPKILVSMFKLTELIKKNNIELVHTNSRTTQALGCLLEKYYGLTHVSTCHGFFKRSLHRKIFPYWGQKVIAISEQVKEHLLKDFNVEESDIRVIHNGIDVEHFRSSALKERLEMKKALGLTQAGVVGIVARLSDVKGHIYLIEAMKLVLEKFADAQLLIVGEGKEKDNLARLVNKLDISKNISFLPEVKDTREVLMAMDVFVMPSLKEGLGLALMEAMAAGLPVVGSNIGGIKTLIEDGVRGLLVEPGDFLGLSEAILELLQDPAKKELFGKQAQEFIAKDFSQEKMVSETERMYLECLGLNS